MTGVPGDHELLGRDAELAEIETFLDEAREAPSALVLEGDAGVGKTALWLAALDRARRSGTLVLSARPAGTDAAISYAGLIDLLDRVEDDLLTGLPEPQRNALAAALRRRTASGSFEGGTVAVAFLSVVRRLAAAGPLVLAVDDLHAMDAASRRAFEYVARRLRDEPVGLLVARRPPTLGRGKAPPDEALTDTLPGGRVRHVVPGPLSVGALYRLIAARTGTPLARPLVGRIHTASGGNPQFALEIARELIRQGITAIGAGPLPVPSNVQEIVRARLRRLPAAVRELVAIAAEAERPSLALLRRVHAGEGGDAADGEGPEGEGSDGAQGRAKRAVERALERAVEAGVITDDGDEIRFTHPTVRAAAAHALTPDARRRIHARLADVADDPEERSRHLGQAIQGADAAVAAELDEGAEAAAARGASDAAAAIRARALELTPADAPADQARRRVALAEAVFLAGGVARAKELLAPVVEPSPDVPREVRVEAALLLGTITWYDGGSRRGAQIVERALAEVAGDRSTEGRIHARLSWLCDFDIREQAEHARAALERLDPETEPALYAFALLGGAYLDVLLGRPPDHDAVRRGAELQARASKWEISTIPAIWAKVRDDVDGARAAFRRHLEIAGATGDESALGQVGGYLAELEAWASNLAEARRLATESLDLVRQTGQTSILAVALERPALVDAIEGRFDTAATALAEMRRLNDAAPDPWVGALAGSLETFLELSRGNPAAADRAATEATALLDGLGVVDPAQYRYHADQIEAVIEVGDLDRAERLLTRFEERNRVFPRPWIESTAGRCRALLEAARGDLPAAIAALGTALDAHARLAMPLEHARTLIVGARIMRRAKRRKQGAALAARAVEIAERLGASPWAEQARSEAARLGLEHGAGERLTPSERRIAELAASGLTNREVADRLLVSPKTVEASLARAYAKLGIRSRAQLFARLAEEHDAAG